MLATILSWFDSLLTWLFDRPRPPAPTPMPSVDPTPVSAVADAVTAAADLAAQVDAHLNDPKRIAAIQAGEIEDNTDALNAAVAAVKANPNDQAAADALRKLLP